MTQDAALVPVSEKNESFRYWVRVILGCIDDGIISAGTVILGGGDFAYIASGKVTIDLSKGKVSIALVLGLYVMFKNVRAYLKIPAPPPGGG